jgi:hypothetical protein
VDLFLVFALNRCSSMESTKQLRTMRESIWYLKLPTFRQPTRSSRTRKKFSRSFKRFQVTINHKHPTVLLSRDSGIFKNGSKVTQQVSALIETDRGASYLLFQKIWHLLSRCRFHAHDRGDHSLLSSQLMSNVLTAKWTNTQQLNGL